MDSVDWSFDWLFSFLRRNSNDFQTSRLSWKYIFENRINEYINTCSRHAITMQIDLLNCILIENERNGVETQNKTLMTMMTFVTRPDHGALF